MAGEWKEMFYLTTHSTHFIYGDMACFISVFLFLFKKFVIAVVMVNLFCYYSCVVDLFLLLFYFYNYYSCEMDLCWFLLMLFQL